MELAEASGIFTAIRGSELNTLLVSSEYVKLTGQRFCQSMAFVLVPWFRSEAGCQTFIDSFIELRRLNRTAALSIAFQLIGDDLIRWCDLQQVSSG